MVLAVTYRYMYVEQYFWLAVFCTVNVVIDCEAWNSNEALFWVGDEKHNKQQMGFKKNPILELDYLSGPKTLTKYFLSISYLWSDLLSVVHYFLKEALGSLRKYR